MNKNLTIALLPGIVAAPTLDGVHLKAAPQVTRWRIDELKTLHALPVASEQRTWWGEVALEHPDWMVPTRRVKHHVSLEYQHLRGIYDQVEEILAAPGPFSLAIWKPMTLTYQADGRVEGWLPWRQAVDVVGAPPKLQASKFEPTVKIGRTGEPLAIVSKDSASFAGTPPDGEAWFLESDQRFKVAAPPGALIFVRLFPIFGVFEEASVARDYDGRTPFREPRSIRLVEV